MVTRSQETRATGETSQATSVRLGVRAIAKAMRIARQQIVDGDPGSRPAAQQMHAHCCRELADEFAARAASFNRAGFLAACGVRA